MASASESRRPSDVGRRITHSDQWSTAELRGEGRTCLFGRREDGFGVSLLRQPMQDGDM